MRCCAKGPRGVPQRPAAEEERRRVVAADSALVPPPVRGRRPRRHRFLVVREGLLVSTAAAGGTVFIAWDVGIPDLGLTVGDLVRDPATRDRVRALSTDDLEQGSIARKVREGIDRQARFVAFVDAANIQVGFELGYALGRGKAVSICRA